MTFYTVRSEGHRTVAIVAGPFDDPNHATRAAARYDDEQDREARATTARMLRLAKKVGTRVEDARPLDAIDADDHEVIL